VNFRYRDSPAWRSLGYKSGCHRRGSRSKLDILENILQYRCSITFKNHFKNTHHGKRPCGVHTAEGIGREKRRAQNANRKFEGTCTPPCWMYLCWKGISAPFFLPARAQVYQQTLAFGFCGRRSLRQASKRRAVRPQSYSPRQAELDARHAVTLAEMEHKCLLLESKAEVSTILLG
jgi:hypothetical protein